MRFIRAPSLISEASLVMWYWNWASFSYSLCHDFFNGTNWTRTFGGT